MADTNTDCEFEIPPEFLETPKTNVFKEFFVDLDHFLFTNALEKIMINRKEGRTVVMVKDQKVLEKLSKGGTCPNPHHATISNRMALRSASLRYSPFIFVLPDCEATECKHFEGFCISCFASYVMVNPTSSITGPAVNFRCDECDEQLSTNMFACQYYSVSVSKRGRPPGNTQQKLNDSDAVIPIETPISPATYSAKPVEKIAKMVKGKMVIANGS